MKYYRNLLLLAGCTALAACAADGAKKAAEPVQDGKSEATAVVISAADTPPKASRRKTTGSAPICPTAAKADSS